MDKIKLEGLKSLVKGSLLKDVNITNFAENNDALIAGLCEYFGVDPTTEYRKLRTMTDFGIIEEMIDEILPKQIENILGSVAEVKPFKRNEEVKFTIKDLGKRRAMLLGIKRGARAGVYKAHRLDSKEFSITTETWTAGVNITLENILLGQVTLGELMDNILQGFEYRVYVEIVKALRTAKTMAPAANIGQGAGIVTEDLDKIVRIVNAYGTPSLICFRGFANNFTNASNTAYTPNVPTSDLDEVKAHGFVGVYKGTKVVVLPNFIADETTNDSWIFSEADCFVLPTAIKPVLVAMQGEGYFEMIKQNLGGEEMHYHKIMGIGLVTANNIGIYTDTEIESAEANNFIA